jgi:hypothetical protein
MTDKEKICTYLKLLSFSDVIKRLNQVQNTGNGKKNLVLFSHKIYYSPLTNKKTVGPILTIIVQPRDILAFHNNKERNV